MKRQTSFYFLLMSLVLLLSVPHAFGQITIGQSDILGLIGQSQIQEQDTSWSIPVNVGGAGSNQLWDFRQIQVSPGLTMEYNYLDARNTPHTSQFPGANLSIQITVSGGSDYVMYQYFETSETALYERGMVQVMTSPVDTTIISRKTALVGPLPLTFGTSWTTVDRDTTGFPPFLVTITYDSIVNTVDAWGNIQLPGGDHECLRLRLDTYHSEETLVNGVPSFSEQYSHISYDWIARESFIIVSVQSQNNELNPNFSDASFFTWLGSGGVGITRSTDILPGKLALYQNTPNPFNPATSIQYDIPEAAMVLLRVHDLTGKEIVVLADGHQAPGRYTVRWDGRDSSGHEVSSGVYFYSLLAGDQIKTGKMLYLR